MYICTIVKFKCKAFIIMNLHMWFACMLCCVVQCYIWHKKAIYTTTPLFSHRNSVRWNSRSSNTDKLKVRDIKNSFLYTYFHYSSLGVPTLLAYPIRHDRQQIDTLGLTIFLCCCFHIHVSPPHMMRWGYVFNTRHIKNIYVHSKQTAAVRE